MKTAKEISKVDGSKFLSIAEAAERLGVKETAIRNYLHAHKLTTYKFKSLTLLSVEEVDARKEALAAR